MSFHSEEALARRGMTAWGLDAAAAEKFANTQLESGFSRFSRKALSKLLPQVEAGASITTAIMEVYPGRGPSRIMDSLPSVADSMPELRNPAVARALTELRKVVNSVISRHGKPAKIRVELARDLKKTRDQRKKASLNNRQNQKLREDAAQKILDQANIQNPSRDDILKVLLADECNWECPYTGRGISMKDLFGDNPQFDIEHMIPFARSMDNSYVNVTLCHHETNRNVKKNYTPFEAFGSSPEWDRIVNRVKKFNGRLAKVKLQRFTMEKLEDLDSFANRQLTDTRYASKLAKNYLGFLYGPESASRVQANSGGITAKLRNAWNLNSILGDGGEKSRDDHRHHAVDAVAIALSDMGIIRKLNTAYSRTPKGVKPWKIDFPEPWTGFLDQVRDSIDDIVVSRRVCKKVDARLHQETLYSKPKAGDDGKECRHVRKALSKLSKPELNKIVDPVVRQRVIDRMAELGGSDPSKLFAAPENLPCMETKDGRKIPIKKVRVRTNVNPITISKDTPKERYVLPGSNHHVEIFEYADKKGNVKWGGCVVTTLEAVKRRKDGLPIVNRDHGPEKKFLFSLAAHESVLMLDKDNKDPNIPEIFTVSKMSQMASGKLEIDFRRNADARQAQLRVETDKGIKNVTNYVFRVPNTLRQWEAKKVLITPIGEIRWAND